MTIQQTERARELAPCPWCAGLNIEPDEEQMFCVDCEAVGPRVSFGEPRDRNERWNLRATPQTSEEVMEAVARAIAASFEQGSPDLAKNMRMDWQTWAPEARAAIAAMPSIPQESDAEVTEAMLVVKNSPLKITLPDYWRTCAHEWAIYGDGGDLGGNRIEVQCRKCKCPGDYDEDHMEVVWPTT